MVYSVSFKLKLLGLIMLEDLKTLSEFDKSGTFGGKTMTIQQTSGFFTTLAPQLLGELKLQLQVYDCSASSTVGW